MKASSHGHEQSFQSMLLGTAIAWTPFCSSFETKEDFFLNGSFYHELHIRNPF
jgi:hypothetical protein